VKVSFVYILGKKKLWMMLQNPAGFVSEGCFFLVSTKNDYPLLFVGAKVSLEAATGSIR